MRILLVDDHPLVLFALQTIIHSLDSQTTLLAADNPQAAFAQLVADPTVDLVLLDLMLGQAADGFTVLAELREHYPALPVVVVSASERLTDMVQAVDMGAMGFVSKALSLPALTEALTMVLAGGVFIPTALLGLVREAGMSLADAAAAADAVASAHAARMRVANSRVNGRVNGHVNGHMPDHTSSPPPGAATEAAMDGAAAQPAAATPAHASRSVVLPPRPAHDPPAALAAQATPWPAHAVLPVPVATAASLPTGRDHLASLGLTPRQTDVLQWLLKGLPNKLIARELNLSVDTVKDHVAAVLRGLGVSSRTQAVLLVGQRAQQAAQLVAQQAAQHAARQAALLANTSRS